MLEINIRAIGQLILPVVIVLSFAGCGSGGGSDGGDIDSNPTIGGDSTDIVASGCAEVVYIQNDAPSGGDGSKSNPINTLEAFGYFTANVIYMMSGTSTTLNQDNGIILYSGQKLLGDSISYSDDCNTIKAVRSFSTTGPLPTITNSAGSAVNLQGNNEVAGVRLDSPLIGIILTSLMGPGTTTIIHHNVFKDAGISATFVSGDLTISSNEISNNAIGIVDDDTTLNVIVKDNTLTGDDSGIGLSTTTSGNGTAIFSGNTIENTTGRVAIQIVNRSGTHTIDGNTINGTEDYGIEFDNVSGTGTISNNTITNTLSESIFVETENNQILALTVEKNVLNDSQPEFDQFADGIVLSMRDSSTITGTISDNMINDAGSVGLFISNLNNSQSTLTLNNNTINDADTIGLFLDNQSDASITTVVSNNTINRSGDDGVEVRISNDGNNSYTLTGNQITDASWNGIAVNVQGDFILDNLDIRSNTVNGSFIRGIDFLHTSGPGNAPVITSSITQNNFTGNGDEGIRMFVGNDADMHSHVTENIFINNGGSFGFYARAAGTSALCIALAENESDNDFEIEALNGGIVSYENLLSTNGGFVALTNFSGTLGQVAVGSCRDF